MTDDRNTREHGEEHQQEQGPEPEGGPFARREAFLQERFASLEPKRSEEDEDSEEEDEDSEPEESSESDEEPPSPGAMTRSVAPPDVAERAEALESGPGFRRQVINAYRQRQREQLDRQVEALRIREARPDVTEARTAATDQEDALFGPEIVIEPPQAPAPPPANNWIPIGPSVLRQGQGATQPSTSGRINGIAVAAGGTRIYAAATNGGVWRSDDTGRTWRSLMDAWDINPTTRSSDSLSCGSIAIDPSNPDRIFVGTGDGNEAAFFGVGPVVSPDGGVNWATEPVAPGSPSLDGTAINAMAVDPGNPNRVVAGTWRGLYRREPNPAGGFHWARKTGPTGMISSIVVARSGTTTTFYAAPWIGPVYSSNDGHTWTPIGTGFPTTNVGRVDLGVRASDPSVVYALVAANDSSMLGVWRLDTSSGQWRQISGHPADLFGTAAIGFQGQYDLAIAVDPNNANLIYLGGSTKLSAGQWSGSVYRSSVTSSGSGSTLSYSMTNAYIGGSVHADIHDLVFAPGDSNKLWVGCDGGAFYSTNPTGSGNIFEARNTGLQTLTMNQVDHHPTEDAVVFGGTQDNGGARFTGEEAWLHSVWGDSGGFVINWNDPYRVLATYVRASINRSTDGGTRYNYSPVSITLPSGDSALFYAPLAGTPPSANPAEAERVAFGSRRVWISETFGGGWSSIPNNNSTDDVGSQVRSLRFASFNKLYAGTMSGRVYRFTRSGGTWTSTRLDTMGGANSLPLSGAPVTSIAIDPVDTSGDSIYLTFGGGGDYRHVWHFNGTQWQQRSGPSAGATTSLLDVQHNAVVCDPANPGTLYVGADIGVWRSTDSGATWSMFSFGLPDAAVLDLDLHSPRRLLRASTYGRGVFEFRLDTSLASGIELYVRDTQLDQGRSTTVDGLPDPTAQGQTVRHWVSPDIKLDTPDVNGNYQFPITPGTTIDFEEFTNRLSDDFQNVATHATATITTRVYVQVHNRGVTPANNVRVMLLVANASMGLPNLPFGFTTNVQNGTPITTPNWRTVGFATLNDVRVGFPKIASFDLPSNMLPPPANLAGNNHHCVLALVHHATSDPLTATQTVTDLTSVGERKAAHKNLTVVQFTGTLPAPPPVVMVVRLHNPSVRKRLLTTLLVRLNGYPGRVRMYLPSLRLLGDLDKLAEGCKRGEDFDDFRKWSEEHIRFIEENQESETPYDKEWSQQRVEDVHAALESGIMLTLGQEDPIKLRNIVMSRASHHTIFLLFDRPPRVKVGTYFPIEIRQLEARKQRIIGGLNARIEVVPSPKREREDAHAWQGGRGGNWNREVMKEARCSLAVPGELLVSFFDRDEAASRLVERLRREPIDGISHVQSLEEKLDEAHTLLRTDLELEFHLLRVPEGQEQWAVTHLQYLYGVESRQTRPDEDLASWLGLPEYNFTVVSNGVLSLPGAGGGAASVRAADFAFDPVHDTYKTMLGLSGAPADAGRTTVAILDSGIADDVLTDPRLSEKFNINMSYDQGRNFIDSKASSEVTDENGHGTVVASIINDIAPGSALLIGKVANASGHATEWDTLAAIAASAHADVINMSLQFGLKDRTCGECGHQSQSSRSAVFSNMIGQVHRTMPGPLFVAAAGNVNLPAAPDGELAFPSRFADVLAVGSINSRWELSSFSFYGNRDHKGNAHLNHYVMPGGEPNGTSVESIGSFEVGDGPHFGTSFAAAYASGMIARSIGEQGLLDDDVRPADLLQTLRDQTVRSSLRDYTAERFGNGVLRL